MIKVLIALTLLFTVSTAEVPKEHLSNQDALRIHISSLCSSRGISEQVVYGIIGVESRGKSKAVGQRGEIGLMQIMPSTAGKTKEELFDPFTNTRGGITYLAKLKAQMGSERLALLCYNRGPGTVKRLRVDRKPYDNGYPRRVYEASKTTVQLEL